MNEPPSTNENRKFISPSEEDIVREIQEKDWEDSREHFSSRMYFLLAMIQMCLSFHGVFGCPLATMNHGGIVFFIPYTIFMAIVGYPIHFMECSLGQYSQLGPVKVWNCVPLARGIGLATVSLCCLVAVYNNIYAVYAMLYFARCFNEILPWSACDKPSFQNRTCVPRMSKNDLSYTPAEHYFYDHILHLDIEEHIGHYHSIKFIWQQCLVLFYSWFIIYLCSFQNLRSLERFLPIFVGVPIFCLLILLSVSVQLRGAFYAISFFTASKNFQHLERASTWCKAAELVLVELGISQGTLITYGSYSYHRNKIHLDSGRIVLTKYFISVGTTIITWFLLGSLSSEMASRNLEIHFKDFSYVFVLFTEVLGTIPGARIWCCCIFLLIFISCLNSAMPILQTISCALFDQFPLLLDLRGILNIVLCIFFASSGILLCTSNTWFVFQTFHTIPNVLSRIPIASLTVAVIVLIYGINKYCEDLHFLINYYPCFLLRLCFYTAPFIMLGLYITNWNLYSPFINSKLYAFKFILYLILIWKPIGFLYWIFHSASEGTLWSCWRSLDEWGPANERARIARAYFSSDSKVTLSMPWTKPQEITDEN